MAHRQAVGALQGAEARNGYIEFIENLCHKYTLTSLIYWFRLLWHVPPPLYQYPAT